MKRMVGYTAGVFIAVGFLLLAAFSYFIYAPLPRQPQLSGRATTKTLQAGAHVRSYLEYVPANLPPDAPLLIVLHGRLMTGEMMREMTGYEFDRAADREHFAVIYPNGYGRTWHDCRKDRIAQGAHEHVDDVAFVRMLIAAEHASRDINLRKVFAVGFSNGGHMAMDLALEKNSPVAGVAIFAAGMPVRNESTCPFDTPTPPVMLVEGTQDPIIPFNGGEANLLGFEKIGNELSALATAKAFVRRDDIRAPETTTDLPHRDADDPTSIQKLSWLRDGKPYVVLYKILGGGHVIPEPDYRFPRLFGRTSRGMDGPAQAVAFFLHR